MSRTAILKRLSRRAGEVATLGKRAQDTLWLIAADLVTLQGTYPAGDKGTKAFKAAAATATGYSESGIVNLVRAQETLTGMNQVHRAKVEGWATGSVYQLRGLTPAQRTRVLALAEKKGTSAEKEVRAFRAQVAGKKNRNTKNATDKKIALANEMSKTFQKLAKSHNVLDLIVGAQLAQDNPGKDIAGALTFWNSQVTKAATVVKA